MHKFLLILAASSAIFVTGFFLLRQTKNAKTSEQSSITTDLKIIQSNTLDFSVEVPLSYQIEEKNTYTDLLKGNLKINISRNGTNFENIADYLESFDQKRMLTVSSEEKVQISSYDSVRRVEIFKRGPIGEQKVYFIYADNWVFSLSTSDKELYSDLDQIAQSFLYTP